MCTTSCSTRRVNHCTWCKVKVKFRASHLLEHSEQAVPAVSSAYIAPCVLQMVPADADLVFIEFTVNDAEHGAGGRLDDDTRQALLSPTMIRFIVCNLQPLI